LIVELLGKLFIDKNNYIMENRKIRITDQQRMDNAISTIALIPLDGSKEVVIRDYKKTRSASQQALQWMWNTDIAEATGETKEEVHERCKKIWLKPILIRDDHEFAELISMLRDLYKSGDKKKASHLANFVIKESSTTKLNVSQMSEYLTCVERFHSSQGIALRYPDDYKFAIGNNYE